MTTPPAPGRRERRKEATRSALLDAAMRLFDDRGYRAVTVEDICADADVAPRTFFRYFPSKDDVLLAPVHELLDAVLEDLRARPEGEPAWDALVAVVRTLAANVDADHEQSLRTWRVLQDSPETLGANARSFLEWDAAMGAHLAARAGADDDDLRPRLLTHMALGAFRVAFDAWGASDGRGRLADRVDDALAIVEAGPRSALPVTPCP